MRVMDETRRGPYGQGGEYVERIRPRGYVTGGHVVVAHGGLATGVGLVAPTAVAPAAPHWQVPHATRQATGDGWTSWAADLGGGSTWGNAASQTALTAVADLAARPVVLVGISMGWLTVARWAADNPSRVAAMIGIVPAVSLDMLYPVWGPLICAAHGVTPVPQDLPAAIYPADPWRHTDEIAALDVGIEVWSEDGDVVVDSDPPHWQADYATAIGAARTVIGAAGHTVADVTPAMWTAGLARLV